MFQLDGKDNGMSSDELGNLFTKKFYFSKQSQWKIPQIGSIFDKRQTNQTMPELMRIKGFLNHVKDQLNNYPLNAWSKFTSKHDLSSGIVWHLRHKVKVELATRAWCKFYECLSAFPIVSVSVQGEFNSVRQTETSNFTLYRAKASMIFRYIFAKHQVHSLRLLIITSR